MLTKKDIRNGEIVWLLDDLEFYASIYEPKTAAVMLHARDTILELITNLCNNGKLINAIRRGHKEKKLQYKKEIEDLKCQLSRLSK